MPPRKALPFNLLEVFKQNRAIADILDNPIALFVLGLANEIGKTKREDLQADLALAPEGFEHIIENLKRADLLRTQADWIYVTNSGKKFLGHILQPTVAKRPVAASATRLQKSDKSSISELQREGLITREQGVARGLRVVMPSGSGGAVQIPLLGVISAGHPLPVPEAGLMPYEGETLSLTRDLIKDEHGLLALKVKGNSMIDALISDGDLVVMKKQETYENGDLVAVWLKDEKETILKRIYWGKRRVRLQPMNPTMKAFYIGRSNVEIQGKVVLVLRQIENLPA